MATIPTSGFTSSQVIEEASGTIAMFSSNDADVRDLAGKPSGSYSSLDWAGKSAYDAQMYIGTATSGFTYYGFYRANSSGHVAFGTHTDVGGTNVKFHYVGLESDGKGGLNVSSGIGFDSTRPWGSKVNLTYKATNGDSIVILWTDTAVTEGSYSVGTNNAAEIERLHGWLYSHAGQTVNIIAEPI